MTRILYIHNGAGLQPHVGGSLIRTVAVARHLLAAGHDVRFLTTVGGATAMRRAGLEAPVHLARASLWGRRERWALQRAWSYALSAMHGAMVARRLPAGDVVYSDSDYVCDIVPARAYARRHGAAWVAMVHHLTAGGAGMRSVFARAQRASLRFIARHADAALVYATPSGAAVADALAAAGMPRTAIHAVHNGFDPAMVASARPRATYEACVVGGLRPGKGLHELVPIWRRVHQRTPSARLAVAGAMLPTNQRRLEEELRSAAAAESVAMLGGVSHQEALDVMAGSQVVLAPSLEEGWGITVCEALASRRPVIAYDLPVYRSLFPEGMVLVPVGDRAAFADAAVDLLRDGERRAALGESGARAVAKYTWAEVTGRDLELFHRAAAQPRA